MDNPEDDGNHPSNDTTTKEEKQMYDVVVVPRFKAEGYWIWHDWPPSLEKLQDKTLAMLVPSHVINEYKRNHVKGMIEPPKLQQNNVVIREKEDEHLWPLPIPSEPVSGRKKLKNRKARRKARWQKLLKPKSLFACDILVVPRMWKTVGHFIWHRGQPTTEQLEYGDQPILIPPRGHECQFFLETGTHHYVDRSIVMEHVKNYLLSVKDTSQEYRDMLEQLCGISYNTVESQANKLPSPEKTAAKISRLVGDRIENHQLQVEDETRDEKPDEDLIRKDPAVRRHEWLWHHTTRFGCLWENLDRKDLVMRGAPWDLSGRIWDLNPREKLWCTSCTFPPGRTRS